MKLYELTGQLGELSNMDMDPEMLADTVEGIEGELALKAEGLLSVVANIGSDVDAIDLEIKRLQARQKTMKSRQEWLREYLRFNMDIKDIEKISCPLFTITLRKAPVVANVDNEDLIPPRFFKKIPATRKLVKKDVLDALKAGKKVPGAVLGFGKRGLIIK